MERIVSTIVEDAPKELYIVAVFNHRTRKDDNGNPVSCANILKPHKKVISFDEEGNMNVKYYTEEEWNDTAAYLGNKRERGKYYQPVHLDHYVFLRWINECLEYLSICEIAEAIKDGEEPFGYDDLSARSKQLIDYIMDWDSTTPFDFPGDPVLQTAQKEDDDTYYYVECFKNVNR